MGLVKLAVIGSLLALVIQVLFMLDVNKRVYTHHPGPCKNVPGLEDGSEDAILLDNGWAVISSGIHVFGQQKPFAQGKLYAYDMREGAASRKLVELKLVGHPSRDQFHPAGIASWKSGTGESAKYTIYAVNTPFLGVDVFDIDLNAGQAKYRKTINDKLFAGLNNLVLTGPDQFYVTNFVQSTHWILVNLELAVPLGTGNVLFYDGKTARVVANRLKAPNGIGLSVDKRQVYVATTQDESLHIFERNPSDNTLKLLEATNLGSGLDNLNVDHATGSIYIGSHPIAHKIIMNMADRSVVAPSHVLRVDLDPSRKSVKEITEIFADDGRLISASAVALKNGNTLFIGSLNGKAVMCTTGNAI